jgi:hypothetical protein
MAQVKRDGKWGPLPARELLPGDIITLKGGDVIPADSKVGLQTFIFSRSFHMPQRSAHDEIMNHERR